MAKKRFIEMPTTFNLGTLKAEPDFSKLDRIKNEEKIRKKLSPEQYRILREKGTEKPFTGKLLNNKKAGDYFCAACGKKLFSSETKFDSGTGWPSFYDTIKGAVKFKKDFSAIIPRTEVTCSKCGSHLGHVFKDGPKPTGKRKSEFRKLTRFLSGKKIFKLPSSSSEKRYCINSLALDFKKK